MVLPRGPPERSARGGSGAAKLQLWRALRAIKAFGWNCAKDAVVSPVSKAVAVVDAVAGEWPAVAGYRDAVCSSLTDRFSRVDLAEDSRWRLVLPAGTVTEFEPLPHAECFARAAEHIGGELDQDMPNLPMVRDMLVDAHRELFPAKVKTMRPVHHGSGKSPADPDHGTGYIPALRELSRRQHEGLADDEWTLKPGDEYAGLRISHVGPASTWTDGCGAAQTTVWVAATLPPAEAPGGSAAEAKVQAARAALRPELLLAPRGQARFRVGSTATGSACLEVTRECFPAAARADALFFTVTTKHATAQDANQAPVVRVASMCKYVLMPEGAADQEAFFQAVFLP